MRPKAVLFVIISIFIYLIFSYVRIYTFIGEKNLKSPSLENSYVVGNGKSGESIKLVALGDSLTAGVGATNPEETFVYQFALKLSGNSHEINVVNLAHPGDTTEDILKTQVPKALAEKPDYLTLLVGVNDIHGRAVASDFSKNYTAIIQELKNKTAAQIIILNLPYIGADELVYFPFNFLLDFRTKQFNDIITSIAHTYNVKVIDIYGISQEFKNNPSFYSADLFHPSGKGYLLWSQLINAD